MARMMIDEEVKVGEGVFLKRKERRAETEIKEQLPPLMSFFLSAKNGGHKQKSKNNHHH